MFIGFFVRPMSIPYTLLFFHKERPALKIIDKKIRKKKKIRNEIRYYNSYFAKPRFLIHGCTGRGMCMKVGHMPFYLFDQNTFSLSQLHCLQFLYLKKCLGAKIIAPSPLTSSSSPKLLSSL